MKVTVPIIGGPYTHETSSVNHLMLWVMLALLPITAYGLYLFGWPAIFLFSVTVFTAVIAEAVSLWIARRPIKPFLLDGSAILSGWLLALTLPPWAPWWIGVVGSVLAIVIGKHVFGGLGQNLFNPAMVARVALLISFPLQLTTFVTPQPLFAAASPGFMDSLQITFGHARQFDGISSATLLGHIRTELSQGLSLSTALLKQPSLSDLLWGHTAGSMGETSALLIIAGGLLLLARRIISWQIPVAMLGTVALLATIMHMIDPLHYPDAAYHLLSGSVMLGAFFIATDLVTSPVTGKGQLLYAFGCGLLVYVIRSWSGFPEGVAFAVLLMNAVTPLIDYYLKPRVYGRTRRGEPIQYADDATSKEL
ncbi:MAG TPA: RnfABCDGE type electron transport complex subunit D [Gammaproteobacteria bacterium]|nr:RnfABCDGE type electron transport complex subunit D [Gammaproteobacteria bacterium]